LIDSKCGINFIQRAGPPAKAHSPEVNTENGPSSPMRTAQPEEAAKMGSDLRREPGNRRMARNELSPPVAHKKSNPSLFPHKII